MIKAGMERRPSEDLRRLVTVVEDDFRIIVQDLTVSDVTVLVEGSPLIGIGQYWDDIDEVLLT